MAGGACEECSKKERFGLQTKLKVSEPSDPYEQEADRVAARVMAAPAGAGISGASPRIQRMAGAGGAQVGEAPAGLGRALAGGGRPLEPGLRRDMERRFGYDFSRVRVHADARAAGFARMVEARAFTFGENVAFGAGEFAPSTREGKRLLAHELVHVIQQHGSENSNAYTIQRDKGKGTKDGGKQVVIIAGGYPGYASDKSEVADAQSGLWFPSTIDFNRTASDTQKADISGASDADQFFGALQGVKGKIKRLVFIGHGHSSGLGLSGKPMSWFEKGLDDTDLSRWQASIDMDIKPKFAEGATLDIYACNVALGATFIKALAQSLGICVRAFTGTVYWCLGFKGHVINSRGRLADSRVKAVCSDKQWFTGVNKLAPPNKVCG